MKFFSTRDARNIVGFKQAVLDCIPSDGGLYVPDDTDDLRRWIYYPNEKTISFDIEPADDEAERILGKFYSHGSYGGVGCLKIELVKRNSK